MTRLSETSFWTLYKNSWKTLFWDNLLINRIHKSNFKAFPKMNKKKLKFQVTVTSAPDNIQKL